MFRHRWVEQGPNEPARTLSMSRTLREKSTCSFLDNERGHSKTSGDVTRSGFPSRSLNGTVNLFMLFAPLEGWRHVEVTDQRTPVDFARILKGLSDTHFPSDTVPPCSCG
jgi:hypothetical protein